MSRNLVFYTPHSRREVTASEFEEVVFEFKTFLQRTGKSNLKIGIFGNKSIEHIAFLTAILELDHTFYHFNVLNPPKNHLIAVDKLQLDLLFIDAGMDDSFVKLKELKEDLTLSKIGNRNFVILNDETRESIKVTTANPLAYIVSTSGTTGSSKYIGISNQQLKTAIKSISNFYNLESEDSFLHLSDFCFDVAIADFFIGIQSRANLVFVCREKVFMAFEILKREKISVWSSAPFLAKFLMGNLKNKIENFDSLKRVIHCGESFENSLVMNWKLVNPKLKLVNLYGPAEATIAISGYEYFLSDKDDLDTDLNKMSYHSLPIGRIFPEHSFKINREGILLIKGIQIITHYYDQDESLLDEEGFYFTGDRVELNTNEELVYLGRIDDQIKRNGIRFQLKDIESILESHFKLQTKCLLVIDNQIVLFMLISDKNKFELSELNHLIANTISKALVIQEIIYLKSIPFNTSGKIDREFLKAEIRKK